MVEQVEHFLKVSVRDVSNFKVLSKTHYLFNLVRANLECFCVLVEVFFKYFYLCLCATENVVDPEFDLEVSILEGGCLFESLVVETQEFHLISFYKIL